MNMCIIPLSTINDKFRHRKIAEEIVEDLEWFSHQVLTAFPEKQKK